MDVTDECQVDAAVAAAIEIFGRLDILVSNAGTGVAAPLESIALAQWRDVLAVHLDGAFLATRAALPYMYQQGGGTFIYIGAVQSSDAAAASAPYVLAKQGLIGLADVVGREGAVHGVRAAVICPGVVRPSLGQQRALESAPPGVPETVRGGGPANGAAAGTRMSAADIAAAALLIASAEAPGAMSWAGASHPQQALSASGRGA
jgi:3-hydroxybutyrate dehydrogenase